MIRRPSVFNPRRTKIKPQSYARGQAGAAQREARGVGGTVKVNNNPPTSPDLSDLPTGAPHRPTADRQPPSKHKHHSTELWHKHRAGHYSTAAKIEPEITLAEVRDLLVTTVSTNVTSLDQGG